MAEQPQSGKDKRHKRPRWEKKFPVNGQGTLIFNTDRKMVPFYISVEDDDGCNWIALHIGTDFAKFIMHRAGGETIERAEVTTPGCGLEEGKVSYWYSYDRDNLLLKYGKGYRMEETTILAYAFLKGANENDQERIREIMYPFFNAEGKKTVKLYEEATRPVALSGALGIEITEPKVEFDKNPLVCNVPPLVMDSSQVNLFALDKGDFVFSASLPPACKELYENIKGCDLNYRENKKEKGLLSDAIRYSIEHENCILYEKLREKQGELGPDAKETYLRVTLGHGLGKSPGIPYVLEIWPAGHYSPIHNHGNANAVIKVLFGSITINIYNKQKNITGESVPPNNTRPETLMLKSFEASAGDVTWIDRNWYQTHQLINTGKDYCATIQCYKYDAGDMTHWPYFDYLSENETIAEFLPTSDFDFLSMRAKVLEEYKCRDVLPQA